MDPGQADELAAAVRELQAVVAAQAREIAQLRAELSARHEFEPAVAQTGLQVSSRRRFFALAAAAGAAAAVSTRAAPAAALNGADVGLAIVNSVTAGVASTTVLDYSPANAAQVDYLRVSDGVGVPTFPNAYVGHAPAAVAGHARTNGTRPVTGVTGYSEVPAGNGVLGLATGTGGSYGVWGVSETGFGVVGRSFSGYDFFAEGAGRIGLVPHTYIGPPVAGTYSASDIIRDSQGSLWTCVISGAPGVWREIAGPTSAGAFHPVTPTRVYDSRLPEPAFGLITTGSPRTISVASGRDPLSGQVVEADLVPVGATAIACNVTVTDTVGSGFAVVNPGLVDTIGASTINWQPGQVLANAIIVGIDDERRVTLVAGGGGAADIVVDVSGYFR